MRGPVWKSWIRDPNALKIEATCTPVAPAPTTSIDGGTEVKRHASQVFQTLSGMIAFVADESAGLIPRRRKTD
ncbi:MAG: hypothetical protein WCD56_11535, partial [Pseudolabrys sp.]